MTQEEQYSLLDASYRSNMEIDWIIQRLKKMGYSVNEETFRKAIFDSVMDFACLKVTPPLSDEENKKIQNCRFDAPLFPILQH